MKQKESEMELRTPTARDFLVSSIKTSHYSYRSASCSCHCSQNIIPQTNVLLGEYGLPVAIYFEPFNFSSATAVSYIGTCQRCGFAYGLDSKLYCDHTCERDGFYLYEQRKQSRYVLYTKQPCVQRVRRRVTFVLDITEAACASGLVSAYSKIFSPDIFQYLAGCGVHFYFFFVSARVHFLTCQNNLSFDTLHTSMQQCIDQDYTTESYKLLAFFESELVALAQRLNYEERAILGTVECAQRRPLLDALLNVPKERLVFVFCAGTYHSDLCGSCTQMSASGSDNDADSYLEALRVYEVFVEMASSAEFARNAYYWFICTHNDAGAANYAELVRGSGGYLCYYEFEMQKLVADARRGIMQIHELKFDISLRLKASSGVVLAFKERQNDLFCADAYYNLLVGVEVEKRARLRDVVAFQLIAQYSDFDGSAFISVITATLATAAYLDTCVRSINPGILVCALGRITAHKILAPSSENPDFNALDGFFSAKDYVGAAALQTVYLYRSLGDWKGENKETTTYHGSSGIFGTILHGIYGLFNSNLLADDVTANDRIFAAMRMETGVLTAMLRIVFPIVYCCEISESSAAMQVFPNIDALYSDRKNYYLLCENKRGTGLCLIVNSSNFKHFDFSLDKTGEQSDIFTASQNVRETDVYYQAKEFESDDSLVCMHVSFGDLVASTTTQTCIQDFLAIDSAMADGGIQLLDINKHSAVVHFLLYESGYEDMATFELWTQNLYLAADKLLGNALY